MNFPWQPLETAPKDGTTFMVWNVVLQNDNRPETVGSGRVEFAKYAKPSIYAGQQKMDEFSEIEKTLPSYLSVFTEGMVVFEDAYKTRATHWMPLPEKP